MLEAEQVRETAEALRRLIAAVDAGEIDAGPDQRAYLRGAVDVLDELVATDIATTNRAIGIR